MSDDLYKKIYNKSLDLLSRREHSKKELKQKLSSRFKEEQVIQLVLEKLISNDLLNDIRFAESYVASRKRKGFGPKRISYELRSKGIPDKISIQAISREGGWNIAAKKAFEKKFNNNASKDTKEILKQKNFLHNRGFSFREIETVFGNDMI